MKMYPSLTQRLLSLFIVSGSLLFAQQGDQKEKQKDLLSSLNWKRWSPEVVPLYTPEESLSRIQVAPGFRVELVAHEPMIKDPVFVIGMIREECGSANYESDGSGRKRGRGAIESGDGA